MGSKRNVADKRQRLSDGAFAVMTCQEFADLVGKDYEVVRRACAKGGLPAYKVGGLWFISRAELTR